MNLTPLLTAKEAASYTRLSEAYLAKLRHAGGSCPYIRASAKKILYRLDDLDAWLEQRRFVSTSTPAVKGGAQ